MKHPQTLAEELYKHFPTKNLKAIKDYGCCAFVLLWCLGIEAEDINAIMYLDDLINGKSLEEDCTVKWADVIKTMTGRKMTGIEFVSIDSIKDIKGRTPVRFDYGKKSHWVGVENGRVVFNPLKVSNCVEKGKPVTKRVIHIEGVEL